MVARSQRYDLLARLLDYPEAGGYADAVARCVDVLEDGYAEAAAQLRRLHDHVRPLGDGEIQELYTRTFDINAVCTLEIGWHIYGEDYARGALLVKMRQRLREMNLPESQELPDHLTHVLALLGRLAGEEADEVAAHYVIPALQKMLAGMQDKDVPYLALLQAVMAVVKQDHDVEAVPPRERKGDPPGLKSQLPVFGDQGCPRR
jgi:nitrate reductase molybdenum cofactor assembly chaperone